MINCFHKLYIIQKTITRKIQTQIKNTNETRNNT
jgi:hypothetical protein